MTAETELQYLKGIGPKRAQVLRRAGISTTTDLFEYFPRRYIDRRTILSLDKIKVDEEITVLGRIESAGVKRFRKKIYYIIISDGKGILEAVWFGNIDWIKKIFKVGDWVSLSGKVKYYRGYQMTHPDFDRIGKDDIDNLIHTGKILPVYPLTEKLKEAGLNSYTFRRIFVAAIEQGRHKLAEILPPVCIERNHFYARTESLRNVHIPESPEQLNKSIERFKYEEFFFLQLMLILTNRYYKNDEPGIAFEKKSDSLENLYASLPFKMTEAQKKVVKEIRADMKRPHPMNRLIQGDVGSGKTLVAVMAMLISIDNNFQAALMVPTEILAEQHFRNIKKMLHNMKIPIFLLTGSTKNAEREKIFSHLKSEKPLILIGTHALIQEKVHFSRLGLVVIDEQHRFGVMQRAQLKEKGIHADVLVLTATPIPRTLALTLYGSLDVSVIDELPPNRQPINTKWYFDNQQSKIHSFIRMQIEQGKQVFIVFPLVEESEKLDLKAATESFQKYRSTIFKDYKIALIHGKMKIEDKDKVMSEFSKGEIQILISTTVIEVGVDIPNATLMVIEHAERFGLSQLHQLRGRVGRGADQSYCILKTPYNIGEIAIRRMKIMTESNDGFRIAEEDMQIRGSGEFFGTKQHGIPAFKYANPVTDHDILLRARRDATYLLENDPQLRREEHLAVKNYLIDNYREKMKLINIS